MFSIQYIEKCKKAQDEILSFRASKQFNAAQGGIVTLKPLFEVGDYFHHPDLMEEGEVKIVKKISGESLYALDSTGPYPHDESIWVPTADQIRAGLRTIVFSLGDVSDYNEEQLLDKYMEKKYRKKWDEENNEWVKI